MRVYRLLPVVFACLILSGCSLQKVEWGPLPNLLNPQSHCSVWGENWCDPFVKKSLRRTAVPGILWRPE
jgi:hypothetical protein